MSGDSPPEPGAIYMGSIHPTGITELYIPSSPVVDICFIHGFTGHPERTWPSKKRAINTELPAEKYLLPHIVPNARVLTFGYDTNIRHSLNGPISQNGLGDHAADFLSALESCRIQDARRPLIFVAHSLGGLLVKDMLRLSKSYENSQPDRFEVYESTTNLFFFGTPHAGADPRNPLHRVLTNITKAVGFRVNEAIVQTLMPGAERSKLLAEDFLKWTSERDWGIYTFQEEFAHGVLGVKIVDDHSSSIHDRCHERIVHIRADHVDMCRFTGADDPEFRKVSSAILHAHEKLADLLPRHPEATLSQGHELPETSGAELSSEQIDKVLDKLSFDGIDARYMTLKSAQRKTCQWLLKHQLLKSWADPSQMDTHHGFLWIKGKPGTGKSISMKYLCQNAARAKTGSIREHSTEGMYRSLLWQLVTFLSLEDAASWPIEALKEAFDSVIMQINSREVFCFVDALDECPEDEIRDMIYFFEELGERSIMSTSNMKVCFSSRHYPHITIRHGLQLVLEDEDSHSNDIQHYIHSQLRIDHDRLRQKIEAEIFEKSSNIFLWAALVVDILNKENDKGGNISVQKRLHMLTRDAENIDEMILCIQWILFAKRPLRPEELYFAIQKGSGADACMVWDQEAVPIDHINRFNLNVSKGLAEVTKKHASIQCIHESVRDYLLRENGLETLLHFSTLPRNLNICLAQVQVAQSAQESSQHQTSQSTIPFLEYAVTYILHHADSAQSSGSDQTDFLSNNKLQRYMSRRHSSKVILLYLLAEQNLASLIRIHPERHNSFTIFQDTERFRNPVAIFALTLEFAQASLEPDQADLDGAHWKRMNTFSLVRSLGSVALLDALWNHIPSANNTRPEGMLASLYPHDISIQMAGYLIQKGALVNAISIYSYDTALTRAVKADMLETAGFLLEKGADPNIISLDFAKSESMVELLIRHGGRLGAPESSLFSDMKTINMFVLALMGLPDNILQSFIKSIADRRTLLHHIVQYGGTTALPLLRTVLNASDTLLAYFKDDGSWNSLLITAARGKNHQVLNMLFELGRANAIKTQNQDECTLLCSAIKDRECTAARHLLAIGAAPDVMISYNCGHLKTAITMSIQESSAIGIEMLKALLQQASIDLNFCNEFGYPPLSEAIRRNNLRAVQLLLSEDSIDINFRDCNGDSPLSHAIKGNSLEITQLLLSQDSIDINFQNRLGDRPLSHAIGANRVEITQLLLSQDSIDINSQNLCGDRPLSHAIGANRVEITQLLLSQDSIDINFQNRLGDPPLSNAIEASSLEITQLLLSHPSIDVDVNRPNRYGLSPILYAARYAHLEVVRLLLADSRVDRKARCNQGRSILDYASGNRDPDVFKLVQDMQ
ncbi:ankyrin [Nemania serpens]|nr:ankyrin [Nemania serpens]